MAEGGIDLEQDQNETVSSVYEAPPTAADILIMSVDQLRTELRVRGVAFTGGTKPELQMLLLQGLGYVVNPPPDPQDGHPELDPTAEEPQLEEAPRFVTVGTVPADPPVRSIPDYRLPAPARSPAPSRERTDTTDLVRTGAPVAAPKAGGRRG